MRVSFPDFFDGLIFWGVLNFFPIIFYLLGALGCKALVNIILCGPIDPHTHIQKVYKDCQNSNRKTRKTATAQINPLPSNQWALEKEYWLHPQNVLIIQTRFEEINSESDHYTLYL